MRVWSEPEQTVVLLRSKVGSRDRPGVLISTKREVGGGVFVFVCELRAVGMETLVIIRWRDVTGPNGSLCDCQCGHFLFSTCPTWLPLAEEI